jgi:hypothetical protein
MASFLEFAFVWIMLIFVIFPQIDRFFGYEPTKSFHDLYYNPTEEDIKGPGG